MCRHLLTIPALGLAAVLAACGGGSTGAPTPAAAGGTTAPAGGGGTFTGGIADAQDQNDLLAILPAELCGKTPARFAFRGESWFEGREPAVIDELTGYGKTVDDAFAAQEVVADESSCSAGIVRIKGATADQVRSINDQMGGDPNATEVTVGGRKVWQDHSDAGTAYFYSVGDAIVTASALDDAHAQEVLALLPKP